MRALVLFLALLAVPGWAAPDLDAGRKLLAHYGWTCESGTVEMGLPLSESLTGNPETFYQSASKAIGLDLSPAAGQEVTVVRYTLSRRSHDSRAQIFAHIAFHKNKIIGAWLSTDAPIAPGISSLDNRDFGSDF
jgi:hypothetical protein